MLTGTAEFLYQHDIFAIWDTRSNHDLTYLFELAYVAFQKPDKVRTPGNGACIFVSKRILHTCQFLGYHADIPLAWLKVGGVFLGFIYAKPSMLGSSLDQHTQFLSFLHEDVHKYQSMGQVALIGDFNARIGTLPDAGASPRPHVTRESNDFGQLLMDVVVKCDMLCATGRLDTCQDTWVGHNSASRIDDAFFDSSLYTQASSW